MGLLVYGFIALVFGAIGWEHRRLKIRRQKRVKDAYDFNPKQTQASGGFASDDDLKRGGLYRPKGIRIGFSQDGKVLRYGGAGHLGLVAAARTGKLLTILVALIISLQKRYSLLLVDPKAEMTCIVGAARKKCGPVYVWNPYKIWLDHMAGLRQVRLNPVADIDPQSITVESDCRKLVSTFWDEAEAKNDPHWGPSGKALFAAIIQALVKYGKPEEKNLPTARAILTGANGHSVIEFARYVMTLPDAYLRQQFSRYAMPGAEESKEISGLISTAITQTEFLSNRAIADSLMAADVSFRQMKKTPGMTLSECLPLNRLDDSKCFSLLSGWFLHCALEEGQRGSRVPCLAVLDEMSQIGYSKAWQDAFGLAAGAAGLQIVAVYQDVSQIVNQFAKSWQTIVQNCGVTMWFGARDEATREYVSKLAGVTQVLSANHSVSMDSFGWPHVTDSASSVVRPVIHPHEVGELAGDEMIVFCESVGKPIKAKRKPYLREFRGKYRKNPYFTKSGFLSWLFE
jgi:type IV secretory pathway TraG/TraD family ATPase VirD4